MRQDAWTHEDDVVLADTTLRHIQDGSTQLAAFEEVAKKLNRTPAACGYRWNASIRRLYMEDIGHAKRIRKERREQPEDSDGSGESHSQHVQATLAWGEVLRFLRGQRRDFQSFQMRIKQLERELDLARSETDRLNQEKFGLAQQIQRLGEEYKLISGDYLALLGIVERARERVLGAQEEN